MQYDYNSGIPLLAAVITEIHLGLPRFAYYNVFIALLNYIEYKSAFTHYIDMYRI